MNRTVLAIVSSAVLLFLATYVWPELFLFSKFMPNSFWTKYFPIPFGGGWVLTALAMLPTLLMLRGTWRSLLGMLAAFSIGMGIAVPASIEQGFGSLTANNLLGQYMWAGIVCGPPVLALFTQKSLAVHLRGKGLTKHFSRRQQAGAPE